MDHFELAGAAPMSGLRTCPCGRGPIVMDPDTGISLYHVWLEGNSFGRPEYGDSCKQCEDEQRARLSREEDGYD
jgi:hypothetical protein